MCGCAECKLNLDLCQSYLSVPVPCVAANHAQTDDVGVFGSPLSNEYALVAKHFGLGRPEICSLARGPIQVIFGSDEDKERLRHIMWTE